MSKKRSPGTTLFLAVKILDWYHYTSNYVKIKFSKFHEYIYQLSVSALILDKISVIGISVKSSIGAHLYIIYTNIYIHTYI